jgi:hypothetical protein
MDFPLYVEAVQTRDAPATPYENKLAGLIQQVFADGHYALSALIAGLNERGSTAPDGQPWNESSFRTEMKRLGA